MSALERKLDELMRAPFYQLLPSQVSSRRMCKCGKDHVLREDNPHSLCRKCEWDMGNN